MRLAVGLISGTSMDGVDAALIGCDDDPDAQPQLLAFRTTPYEPAMRAALIQAQRGGDVASVARLHVALGELFARAALDLLAEASVAPREVTCIGSHGQTLIHLPEPEEAGGVAVRCTLQIGDPATIAARTGRPVVADFRAMDLALGGEGAPLVPLLDWRLYRHRTRGRLLLNLGGVANVTGLPADCDLDGLIAFDTGPANFLLDTVAAERGLPGGIDRDGDVGAAGRADPRLLEEMLSDPYLRRSPPKSADARQFWPRLEASTIPAELSTADLLATLVALTARTVADAVATWVAPRQAIDEVLVSGGGVHNRTLMDALAQSLGTTVAPLPSDGAISPDAKEAVAFAVLALETLAGRPGNVPAATGAIAPAVLGAVVRPPTAAGIG